VRNAIRFVACEEDHVVRVRDDSVAARRLREESSADEKDNMAVGALFRTATAGARAADTLAGGRKVRGRGLVLLGGYEHREVNRELASGRREKVVVHVREDAERIAGLR
jgi:hypothetical protein